MGKAETHDLAPSDGTTCPHGNKYTEPLRRYWIDPRDTALPGARAQFVETRKAMPCLCTFRTTLNTKLTERLVPA